METHLPISMFNDFLFCPYSIYLHNVFKNTSEDCYHAYPQSRGRASHKALDEHTYSTSQKIITGMWVESKKLGVYGIIDQYYSDKKKLIERKYKLHRLYQGQRYQLYAQMMALEEMGFEVSSLGVYSISDNISYPVEKLRGSELENFFAFVEEMKTFNLCTDIVVNINKCKHCIYNSLCDKAETENVY